jgi:hypothetical protein
VDQRVKFVAFFLRDLFGIVQARELEMFREDDCGSNNRPGQGPPTGLVDTGNGLIALTSSHGFKEKS